MALCSRAFRTPQMSGEKRRLIETLVLEPRDQKPDIAIYMYMYIYISYGYNIKHLCNIQIQKYIADKNIIQNYAQMKYKWPVTAIKRLSQ